MTFQRPYRCKECGESYTTSGAALRCAERDLMELQDPAPEPEETEKCED